MGSPRADTNYYNRCWKLPGAAEYPASTNEQLASVPVLEMALNLDSFVSRVEDLAALSSPEAQSQLEYVLLKIAMEIQDKANFLAVQIQNGLKNKERE